MLRTPLNYALRTLGQQEGRLLLNKFVGTPAVAASNNVRFKKMKVKTVYIDERPETEEDSDCDKPISYPQVTSKAPWFNVKAVVGKEFKDICLSDYKGKWLVLFFYPLDFTFVCPTEIIAFNDAAEKFRALDCEVVACSTDSHFSHLAWTNTPRKEGGLGDMSIPILADFNKTVSRDYGVLNEELGAAFRGLFLIDPHQSIRHLQVNDLPVGRSVDEVLRLLKAFQFVDMHGEVCPAGWDEGGDTIKPTTDASKEYFEKVN